MYTAILRTMLGPWTALFTL